jgi:ABC-type transporter Mla subunit MlaD
MRRLIYIALLVAIGPWIVIGIVRESTDDDTKDHYLVRAVFDNASTLVKGEDVKIAGAPVGVVYDMNVTEDNKAAVTLRIDNEDFTPWKQDANCTIRSQGLIGERFVECIPGSAAAEPLPTIEHGDGKGERLLSVAHTSSPVDLDLLNNIMRLPYRERFAILLSEFGTGLAGRGSDLNAVIHRANPALRETEKLIGILAKQNKVLARLARDSDTALAPLARERAHVAHWIVKANETGEASAEESADIRRSFELFPPFLNQLRPLMVDLGGFADQATPVVSNLRVAAPALDRLIVGQGTISTAGLKSFPSLGDALEVGRPALIRARPLIQDLNKLGKQAGPVSKDLAAFTSSLQETGGLNRIADVFYYVALATNGFDSIGHYLRAGLVTNLCSTYALTPGQGCNANFFDETNPPTLSSLAANNAPAAKKTGSGSVPPTGSLLQGLIGPAPTKAQIRQRDTNIETVRERSANGDSPALGPSDPALDYLLGGDQ